MNAEDCIRMALSDAHLKVEGPILYGFVVRAIEDYDETCRLSCPACSHNFLAEREPDAEQNDGILFKGYCAYCQTILIALAPSSPLLDLYNLRGKMPSGSGVL